MEKRKSKNGGFVSQMSNLEFFKLFCFVDTNTLISGCKLTLSNSHSYMLSCLFKLNVGGKSESYLLSEDHQLWGELVPQTIRHLFMECPSLIEL